MNRIQLKRTSLISALILVLILIFGTIGTVSAQVMIGMDGDSTIDAHWQAEVIDSVTRTLNEFYVFPDVAKEMEKYVRKQYKKGAYEEITSAMQFAAKLTEDLREVCHDRHLGLRYEQLDPKDFEEQPDSVLDQMRKQAYKRLSYNNFAFKKLELLPGNIGYIKLDGFNPAEMGGATAVAALNFFANVDALIFDLRENGGGSPSMIQLISSYLFDEPQHLNSFYIRETDSIRQFWTQASVQGPRLTDVDVYVLTSHYTFSGAEEFTYNLKNLKRAKIIGETTGGGAHPVQGYGFPNISISLRVPYGRAINPITGTNWEGTGVTPDIEVPASKALEVARFQAMKKIKERSNDPVRLQMLNWDMEFLKASIEPVTVDADLMKEYAGNYGPRKVWMADGKLWYQRGENPKFQLIPLSENTFMLEGKTDFKLKFERGDDGRVGRVVGHYQAGMTDANDRDS